MSYQIRLSRRLGFLSPLLLYVLLTSWVSGYFSAAVNRGLVLLALRGEVSQAPGWYSAAERGEITSGLLFVLAGYQSRRTLIHIPDSSSSPPFIFLIAVVSSTCHRSRLWTTCVFTSDETEIMFHKLEFKSQLSDLMCRIFPAAVICVVFSELLN